jgi:hypothetical protein
LESRINPVYHSVRRQDAQGLIAAPFTQNSVHPPAYINAVRAIIEEMRLEIDAVKP